MTAASDAIVERVVSGPFEATLDRLVGAIARAGLTLFARIDHARGAREAGLTMPATTALLYGHPKGGTPIMLAAPLAALDLPLRVLVRETPDGRTAVAFHPIDRVLRQAGVPDDLATRLLPAQDLLLKALEP